MILKDLPAYQYHSRPEIGLHQLLEYAKSPAHGEYNRNNPKPSTPPMKFGAACHSYILDSTDDFYRQYAVKPKVDGRTTEGKSALKKFYAENTGKIDISEDEFRTIGGMALAIDKASYSSLQKGDRELSIFVENEGVQVRSRLDHINSPVVSDLKTTDSAHPDDFLKSVINFKYYIQAAFYLDNANLAGLNVNEFYFWAVEKTPPYGVTKLRLSEEFLHAGRLAYKKLLSNYRECRDNDYFPSYPTSTITLHPPQYLLKQTNN